MRHRSYLAHFALATLTAVTLHTHQAPHSPITGTQAIVNGIYNEYQVRTRDINGASTVDMHCYYIGNLGIPASEKWYQCYILKAYDYPPYPNVAPTTYYTTVAYDVTHATQRNVDTLTQQGWTCRNVGRIGVNTSYSCVREH